MTNNLQRVYYNTRGLEHSCCVNIFQVLVEEYYMLNVRFVRSASLLDVRENDNNKTTT